MRKYMLVLVALFTVLAISAPTEVDSVEVVRTVEAPVDTQAVQEYLTAQHEIQDYLQRLHEQQEVRAYLQHLHDSQPRWSKNWDRIQSECEAPTTGWSSNTGNGYYGGLQFSASSWKTAGGLAYAPRADLASPTDQKRAAEKLSNHGNQMSHWPRCKRFG
jgi:hypothetical protein